MVWSQSGNLAAASSTLSCSGEKRGKVIAEQPSPLVYRSPLGAAAGSGHCDVSQILSQNFEVQQRSRKSV